jgi:hypothetical protein
MKYWKHPVGARETITYLRCYFLTNLLLVDTFVWTGKITIDLIDYHRVAIRKSSRFGINFKIYMAKIIGVFRLSQFHVNL